MNLIQVEIFISRILMNFKYTLAVCSKLRLDSSYIHMQAMYKSVHINNSIRKLMLNVKFDISII